MSLFSTNMAISETNMRQRIPYKQLHMEGFHSAVLRDVAMTTVFGFLYMGCTLAPPEEYD